MAAPPDELGHFNHHFSLTFELENHPAMMAMAAAAVIIFLLYLFNKLKSTATSSVTPAVPATTTSTASTLQGPIGPMGTTGATGVSGAPGATGPAGPAGPAGVYVIVLPGLHGHSPLYDTPGGKQLLMVPAGTVLQVTNSAVGPYVGGQASAPIKSSTLWYQTTYNGTAGWISAVDVS